MGELGHFVDGGVEGDFAQEGHFARGLFGKFPEGALFGGFASPGSSPPPGRTQTGMSRRRVRRIEVRQGEKMMPQTACLEPEDICTLLRGAPQTPASCAGRLCF